MFKNGQSQDHEARYQEFATNLPAEVDGEINLDFPRNRLHIQFIMEFEQATMAGVFDAMKSMHPSRKVPTLKFRDHCQFTQGQEVVN